MSAITPAARAGTRPLQTEEATTAPAGTVALEVGADYLRDEPNFLTGLTRDTWSAPVLRLVWSAADNVEIDVEWTGRVAALDDPTFGDVSDWGDVALRAKARLAGGPDHALAARFAVTLPQTSFGNGLGPNTLRMAAQLLGTVAVTPAASVDLNAGLAIHDEPLRPHEQRDFLAYGAALRFRATDVVELMAELAGLAGEGAPGADARHEARAGVRLDQGRVRLDAAVRRGLGDADGRWGATAGLTLRLSDP